MKIYRCLVLDQSYKKCLGMIEAEDEQDVKEKIISQGFSILSVEEVSSEIKITARGFEPIDDTTSRQASSFGIAPPEIVEEEVKKTLNKHHLIVLFVLTTILIGVYFFFVIFPKITQADPDEIVTRYMELGYQKNWDMQFELLGKNLQSSVLSLDQYKQAMEERWLAYPQEHIPDENDESPMILKNMRYQIEPIYLKEAQAEFKIILNYPKETKELIVALARNNNVWRIHYLHDMKKIANYIERLAEGVRPEIEQKMVLELKLLDGFSEEDIHARVTKAKFERLKKMRQDEIERRERVQKRKVEAEKKDAIVVSTSELIENETAEDDLVQEKLEQTLKMIEEMET